MGFDTETTGVVPKKDRVIQAGIVTEKKDHDWLINPQVPIDPGAVAVHGISDDKVKAEGIDPKAALEEVAAHLRTAIEERIPVVIYNAPFDLTLMYYEFERHGITDVDLERLLIVDPLVLDKQMDRFRKGKRKLDIVAAHYRVELSDAHSALADARASVALARILGERFADLAAMDAAELCAAQKEWYAADKERFEAWLRSKGRDADIDRRWPLAL